MFNTGRGYNRDRSDSKSEEDVIENADANKQPRIPYPWTGNWTCGIKDTRHCTRRNFAPRRSIQKKPERCDWHNAYMPELIKIYKFVQEAIKEEFPKIKFNTTRDTAWFHNLSRMIYASSSGVLPIEWDDDTDYDDTDYYDTDYYDTHYDTHYDDTDSCDGTDYDDTDYYNIEY